MQVIGEDPLTEISYDAPHLCIVSCIVNAPTLRPYIFRSYGIPNDSESHYLGGYNHKLREAVQASAAAPGYFEEVKCLAESHVNFFICALRPIPSAVNRVV